MPHPSRRQVTVTDVHGSVTTFPSQYAAAKHYGVQSRQIAQYLQTDKPIRHGALKGYMFQGS